MQNHVDYTITMGHDGGAAAHLLYGWSRQEPRFTWAVETESALRLPRPSAPYGGFLELLATPFLAGGSLPSQRLAVTVDGTRLGEHRLRRPSQLALYVPPRRPDADSMLVRLEHPDGARPIDLGASGDARKLGFAVQAIRFIALDQPMPGAAGRRSAAGPDLARSADDKATIVAAEATTGMPIAAMLERFASVGDNCEFGIMQRQCGAEPLGLLRFAGAHLPHVIRGVDTGFAGLGDPGDVTPRAGGGAWPEWIVHEKRYDLHYHTDISVAAATPEHVLADETARLRFLRRLFVEDLADGRKIYVCKRTDPLLTRDEVMPLFLALNRHAASRLLWVVLADDAHPAGTVVEEAPGLMRGHIDRFAPPGRVPALSVPGWLAVCANAWRLAATKGGIAP
jgi:hypothetical protein